MRDEQIELQLTFDGVFDLDEAVRTAGRLEGVIGGARVRLDFARCHRVDPTGLAHLSEAITSCGGRVELLGLSRHDLVILRYLLGPSEPDVRTRAGGAF